MMNLSDILEPTELQRLVTEHYISRVGNGPLTLYNYTEKATYDRVWTVETRQCRGLIVEEATGRIVAHPFDKFFNVGENTETALEALAARPGAVEMTDKLDGSMITVFWYEGTWQTATRGSFQSTQARAAKAWMRQRPEIIQNWPKSHTMMCEWIAPDNRVVLKYAQPEMVLIGARYLPDGRDVSYDGLVLCGDVTGLRVAPRATDTDLASLIARTKFEQGIEGWVVRWPDGFRVKVKCEDYLRLHRLFSGFGPARIKECMLLGEHERYLMELPEELRAEAEDMLNVFLSAHAMRMGNLQARFEMLQPNLALSRKAYALAVQREPREDWPFLFAMADNKPIASKVLEALDVAVLFEASS